MTEACCSVCSQCLSETILRARLRNFVTPCRWQRESKLIQAHRILLQKHRESVSERTCTQVWACWLECLARRRQKRARMDAADRHVAQSLLAASLGGWSRGAWMSRHVSQQAASAFSKAAQHLQQQLLCTLLSR